MFGDRGQILNAYYFEICSFWFFMFCLILRLVFFWCKKKVYWWDLLLILPLYFVILDFLRWIGLLKVENSAWLAWIMRFFLYSSFISSGIWLLIYFIKWGGGNKD
ncbi:MAG: hypothetical protein MRERV_63c004 [Mycoplasmataceae bacterium RV_VA103A]|nr:MAG: hypothetical protein MRERV_63c004 [Mycoplasmataceae bacterium RV_VA103A]